MRCFRHYSVREDPHELLEPENQVSTPWGGPDHGRCDKCSGSGETDYECLSCIEDGVRDDCPACEGKVRYRAVCPTCEGDGEITRTRRRGVSVFPTAGGLWRYLQEKDLDLAGSVLVELEGELSGDVDLDAERGAILVIPSQVVRVHPFSSERLAELRPS